MLTSSPFMRTMIRRISDVRTHRESHITAKISFSRAASNSLVDIRAIGGGNFGGYLIFDTRRARAGARRRAWNLAEQPPLPH
ncbi:MAG TPA: hypothetical protein VJ747_16965 [Stellaceae bacterium]|nr:hypothetical protein [Stellaceae bacterium]